MKKTHLVAAFAGLLAFTVFAADASAMYNPSTGTWLQRDPGPSDATTAPRLGGRPATGGGFLPRDPTVQYRDGMNLYQYGRSNPVVSVDPMGERIMFISGFMQLPDYGFAEAMAQEVGGRLLPTDLVAGGEMIKVAYASTGGGGPGPEGALREAYQKFVEDKKVSPCSLEQFVVVGFSDGATAIYRLFKKFNTDYPPAFIGLMDLVRTDYDISSVNRSENGTADISSVKPVNTRVENWYQTTGNPSANLLGLDLGFKGRKVIGADTNTNVNIWHSGREIVSGQRAAWEANANLGHGGLYANPQVRAEVIEAVASHYVHAAEMESVRMKKAVPWHTKGGDHW